jgi:cell division septation protein DedD
VRVADAFADLGGALPDAQVSGEAVDITRIQPRREAAAKAEAKPEAPSARKPKEPPKPVHPSRHWVQIATGREVAALKFDWRKFEKQGGDLFKGLTAHTARWGAANRLLVGPLASADKARDLVKSLKGKGIDAFTYQSPEGEEIQGLK